MARRWDAKTRSYFFADPGGLDVEFFSLSGSLSGVLQLGGSLAGSWLLLHFSSDYRVAFMVSSGARALALLILVPMFSDLVLHGPAHTLFTIIVLVRQGAGAIRRLIGITNGKKR